MPEPTRNPDLTVKVGSLALSNPVMLASGTVGYGDEISKFVSLDKLGGIVVKGLSLEPVRGNRPRRIAETPGGMLNSIGLQNIGVEAFVEEKLPKLRQYDTCVVANIWGTTVDDYAGVAARLDREEGVHALELNVSCPNIKEGGISFGTDARQLHRVTSAARAATSKPLWVKLAPGVTDIGLLARAAEEAGADALSAINTIRGMMVDVARREPVLSTVFGGYSGPGLLPVALYLLFEVKRATPLPLIGIGGINELDHVLQFMTIGASAVQVGTANFYNPGFTGKMVDELIEWCAQHDVDSIEELVGSLQLPAGF
ncbi:MAG: dihydroorotate dehydrogenase [Acidobacteria bacterium]|nr:dihydroorotate dehydrogenase [Acidobacteriota bacterium]